MGFPSPVRHCGKVISRPRAIPEGYLGAIRAQRQSLKCKGDYHEDVTYPTGSHWVAATVVLSGGPVVAVHVIR